MSGEHKTSVYGSPFNETASDPFSRSVTDTMKDDKMGLVTRASATVDAKSLGKTMPGNMVVGLYRPDFAIRMLKASVAAGI